jgi:hypothetical protein
MPLAPCYFVLSLASIAPQQTDAPVLGDQRNRSNALTASWQTSLLRGASTTKR